MHQTRPRFTLHVLSAACALSCTLPASVVAQNESPAVEDTSFEIVVTARRREESIADTPVAVSAVSAEAIEQRQIDTVAQIAQFVPNVTFQTGAPTGTGSTTPSIFIRGVGSFETSLGTEPGVGLYVDDVYLARSVGSVLDLVDVDSVQVLRGPQGTLFGRNSVGGAILINTRRPADTFGGSIEAKVGSDDRKDLRASLDLPITDSLRLNIAGLFSERDGYVESDDSDAFGSTDRTAARVALEWQPTPELRITLAGDGMRSRETPVPSVLLGLTPVIPGTPVPSDIQAISNLNGTCFGASVLGNSGNPDCIDQQFIRGPYHSAGGYTAENEIFESQGSRSLSSNNAIDVGGGSLHIQWDLSSTLTFKSISAYRSTDAFWPSNSDHSPNPGIETKNDLDQQQITQELQLAGDSDTFHWVVGAYYMKEQGQNLNVVAFPAVIFRSGGGYETESVAGFAQGTYAVTSSLDLTLGVRYTDERKTFDTLDNQQVIGVLLDPFTRAFLDLRSTPINFVSGETPPLESSETTPHASIAYKWTPDVMTYLSYSKGYKGGGYEQRLVPGTLEAPHFDPEYVDSYELGLKTSLPDARVRLGVAVFHSDYKDMQISVVDGPAPTITNAGDATIDGAEFELTWQPVRELTFNAFAGYLDAQYDSLSERALRSGVTLSKKLPNTSEWQYGAAAGYELALGANWILRPYIEWSYRSELELDAANEPLLHQEGFSLLSAVLTLASVDNRWAVSLSGRNLLDEEYLVSGLAQYNIGEIEGQYERPLQWNLGVKVKF